MAGGRGREARRVCLEIKRQVSYNSSMSRPLHNLHVAEIMLGNSKDGAVLALGLYDSYVRYITTW